MMKKLLTKQFDLQGNSTRRILCYWYRMKRVLIGGRQQGPTLRQIIVLWCLQTLGRPIYWLRYKIDSPVKDKLLAIIRARKN